MVYTEAAADCFCFLETTGQRCRGMGWNPGARPGDFPLGLGDWAGVPNLCDNASQARRTCPGVKDRCESRRNLGSHGRG